MEVLGVYGRSGFLRKSSYDFVSLGSDVVEGYFYLGWIL